MNTRSYSIVKISRKFLKDPIHTNASNKPQIEKNLRIDPSRFSDPLGHYTNEEFVSTIYIPEIVNEIENNSKSPKFLFLSSNCLEYLDKKSLSDLKDVKDTSIIESGSIEIFKVPVYNKKFNIILMGGDMFKNKHFFDVLINSVGNNGFIFEKSGLTQKFVQEFGEKALTSEISNIKWMGSVSTPPKIPSQDFYIICIVKRNTNFKFSGFIMNVNTEVPSQYYNNEVFVKNFLGLRYFSCLVLASRLRVKTIAFPLLGTGRNGMVEDYCIKGFKFGCKLYQEKVYKNEVQNTLENIYLYIYKNNFEKYTEIKNSGRSEYFIEIYTPPSSLEFNKQTIIKSPTISATASKSLPTVKEQIISIYVNDKFETEKLYNFEVVNKPYIVNISSINSKINNKELLDSFANSSNITNFKITNEFTIFEVKNKLKNNNDLEITNNIYWGFLDDKNTITQTEYNRFQMMKYIAEDYSYTPYSLVGFYIFGGIVINTISFDKFGSFICEDIIEESNNLSEKINNFSKESMNLIQRLNKNSQNKVFKVNKNVNDQNKIVSYIYLACENLKDFGDNNLVDVICNASNSTFTLGGGVSGAIKTAFGGDHRMQNDMYLASKRAGKLNTSDRFKYILLNVFDRCCHILQKRFYTPNSNVEAKDVQNIIIEYFRYILTQYNNNLDRHKKNVVTTAYKKEKSDVISDNFLVIHSNGPLVGSTNIFENDLSEIYFMTILAANRLGCKRVLIPAISAGIFSGGNVVFHYSLHCFLYACFMYFLHTFINKTKNHIEVMMFVHYSDNNNENNSKSKYISNLISNTSGIEKKFNDILQKKYNEFIQSNTNNISTLNLNLNSNNTPFPNIDDFGYKENIIRLKPLNPNARYSKSLSKELYKHFVNLKLDIENISVYLLVHLSFIVFTQIIKNKTDVHNIFKTLLLRDNSSIFEGLNYFNDLNTKYSIRNDFIYFSMKVSYNSKNQQFYAKYNRRFLDHNTRIDNAKKKLNYYKTDKDSLEFFIFNSSILPIIPNLKPMNMYWPDIINKDFMVNWQHNIYINKLAVYTSVTLTNNKNPNTLDLHLLGYKNILIEDVKISLLPIILFICSSLNIPSVKLCVPIRAKKDFKEFSNDDKISMHKIIDDIIQSISVLIYMLDIQEIIPEIKLNFMPFDGDVNVDNPYYVNCNKFYEIFSDELAKRCILMSNNPPNYFEKKMNMLVFDRYDYDVCLLLDTVMTNIFYCENINIDINDRYEVYNKTSNSINYNFNNDEFNDIIEPHLNLNFLSNFWGRFLNMIVIFSADKDNEENIVKKVLNKVVPFYICTVLGDDNNNERDEIDNVVTNLSGKHKLKLNVKSNNPIQTILNKNKNISTYKLYEIVYDKQSKSYLFGFLFLIVNKDIHHHKKYRINSSEYAITNNLPSNLDNNHNDHDNFDESLDYNIAYEWYKDFIEMYYNCFEMINHTLEGLKINNILPIFSIHILHGKKIDKYLHSEEDKHNSKNIVELFMFIQLLAIMYLKFGIFTNLLGYEFFVLIDSNYMFNKLAFDMVKQYFVDKFFIKKNISKIEVDKKFKISSDKTENILIEIESFPSFKFWSYPFLNFIHSINDDFSFDQYNSSYFSNNDQNFKKQIEKDTYDSYLEDNKHQSAMDEVYNKLTDEFFSKKNLDILDQIHYLWYNLYSIMSLKYLFLIPVKSNSFHIVRNSCLRETLVCCFEGLSTLNDDVQTRFELDIMGDLFEKNINKKIYNRFTLIRMLNFITKKPRDNNHLNNITCDYMDFDNYFLRREILFITYFIVFLQHLGIIFTGTFEDFVYPLNHNLYFVIDTNGIYPHNIFITHYVLNSYIKSWISPNNNNKEFQNFKEYNVNSSLESDNNNGENVFYLLVSILFKWDYKKIAINLAQFLISWIILFIAMVNRLLNNNNNDSLPFNITNVKDLQIYKDKLINEIKLIINMVKLYQNTPIKKLPTSYDASKDEDSLKYIYDEIEREKDQIILKALMKKQKLIEKNPQVGYYHIEEDNTSFLENFDNIKQLLKNIDKPINLQSQYLFNIYNYSNLKITLTHAHDEFVSQTHIPYISNMSKEISSENKCYFKCFIDDKFLQSINADNYSIYYGLPVKPLDNIKIHSSSRYYYSDGSNNFIWFGDLSMIKLVRISINKRYRDIDRDFMKDLSDKLKSRSYNNKELENFCENIWRSNFTWIVVAIVKKGEIKPTSLISDDDYNISHYDLSQISSSEIIIYGVVNCSIKEE